MVLSRFAVGHDKEHKHGGAAQCQIEQGVGDEIGLSEVEAHPRAQQEQYGNQQGQKPQLTGAFPCEHPWIDRTGRCLHPSDTGPPPLPLP